MEDLAPTIDAKGAELRLSRSTVDGVGVVAETPTALVAQAALRGYPTTVEEYSLARVLASEYGNGPAMALLCLADAEVNRARAAGRTVVAEVTAGSERYGSQGTPAGGGRRRPNSTRLDPHVRHLRAARLVLGGPARGIALGARRYLSPRAQHALWSRGDASHYSPLVVLDRWVWERRVVREFRDEHGRRMAELGPEGPGPGEEPVFPCGVDPWVQLFFRPGTRERRERYELARRLIASGGGEKPPCEGRGDNLELVLAAAFAAAAAAAVVN